MFAHGRDGMFEGASHHLGLNVPDGLLCTSTMDDLLKQSVVWVGL